MKAINITQEIKDKNPSFRNYNLGLKIFTTLPSRFNGIENIGGYYEHHTDKHEADGFWNVERLPLQQYQRHGVIERKGNENLYHYPIIDFTQEEIDAAILIEQNAPVSSEYEKYKQRQRDGVDMYMRISAKFRLLKTSGVLSESEHSVIENILKPVRAEIVLGQWKDGKSILIDIGSDVIGLDLYNELYDIINTYEINSYD